MMQRQGDILIVKIKAIPEGAVPISSRVLAEGEVTGHFHALDEKSDVYDEKGVLYFRVNGNAPSVLSHQEHKPLTFEPGVYQVIKQREYEPNGWRYTRD